MPATDGTTKPRPRPPYRRVAVVGAGPGGLTAARALLAENAFDVIDVYEQRGRAGGTWNHTPETIPCPVPSTDPKEDMREDVSAIYDDLGECESVLWRNLCSAELSGV